MPTDNQHEARHRMHNTVVSKKLRGAAYTATRKVDPNLRGEARNWVAQTNRTVHELKAFIDKMER